MGYKSSLSSNTALNSKQCPFCGRGDVSLYNSSLFVWKCLSCGLLFKDRLQDESVAIYKSAWSDYCNHIDETGATNRKLSKIYSQKLISSLGLKNFSEMKILDFGTGKGNMLMALAELGADVYGIEPFGYEYLKSKGFKIFREIKEIPEGLLFDGIIANDVLEHLFNPWDTINELYGILNINGWFYIATPNAESLNAKFFRSYWREFYNSGHIRFFNSDCIEAIFIKLGIPKYKRLHWFVEYSSNPLHRLIHLILQFFQLDGVLRYMLRRS